MEEKNTNAACYYVAISGTPKGQIYKYDKSGVSESDMTVIKNFYEGNLDKNFFDIRVHDKKYFYSYIVGGLSAGRNGGYFAITIIMNYYCKNVMEFFYCLQRVYNNFIDKKIIDSRQYKVEDFDDELIKKIDEYLEPTISKWLFGKGKVENVVNSGKDICLICTSDVTDTGVEKFIEDKKIVRISNTYESNAVRELKQSKENECEDVKKKLEDQLKEKDKTIDEKNIEISSLQIRLESYEGISKEIKETNKKIEEYYKDREALIKDIKGLSQIPQRLKKSLMSTDDNQGDPKGDEPNGENELHPKTDKQCTREKCPFRKETKIGSETSSKQNSNLDPNGKNNQNGTGKKNKSNQKQQHQTNKNK